MGLVLTYTSKIRQQLKAPANIGIDVIIMLGLAGLIAALATVFGHVAARREEAVHISLSAWALPRYTLYSLARGFVAYGISLAFTLIYGTISAHNPVAEKFMIPALDVLQSIPVLAFLPGVVLAMVHLFPASWLGLELACVIMIFTAQAWNMTFSYHGSVRSIPMALREAAAVQHLSGFQIFRLLEVPASMIGLVWNSMMSMAGGWFIITVNEAFTLNGQDYRLPGLGSYMNQAISEWNLPAMVAGVVAMIVMIVVVDQLFWRPIVVWSQRFKLEDSSGSDEPQSWVLQLFRRSRILKWIVRALRGRHSSAPAGHGKIDDSTVAGASTDPGVAARRIFPQILMVAKWLVVAALVLSAAFGALKLVSLMWQLPIHDNSQTRGWLSVFKALGLSFLRTTAAILIGAAWTLPVGVLIGLSPRWANRLQPFVQIVASFPSPMIFPLVVLVIVALHIPFTIGCVALMLLGTQWYTLFNVIAGAMAVPSELREAGRVYKMNAWQRWTRLYIPAVFPYLLTGLVTAAGGAWNATIVSEIMELPHKNAEPTTYAAFGLGYLITDATAGGKYPLLTASVVTMGLFVVIINRIVWKRLYRYSEQRFNLNV